MIKKTFLFRISGITLFVIGMVLRMKKIPGSLLVSLIGIGLLIIGYVIWLYGTYKRKKIKVHDKKEIEVSNN
tara:strand:- start:989 stop:1204 length:216 start_codon:yes stop_codon:yes gene_type:complete